MRLLEAFDRLRDDWREDLRTHEKRMEALVTNLRDDFQRFVIDHGRQHELEQHTKQEAHQYFDAFIEQSRVAKARSDGAIGVVVLLLNTLGRNWQLIVSISVLIMAALFGVRFEVK